MVFLMLTMRKSTLSSMKVSLVNIQTSRFAWLKILISGSILFYLLERAYVATNDIVYLPSILLVGAVTMPLSFFAFLYSKQRMPHVPWQTLLLCTVWGGALGTIIAGRLEYSTVLKMGA